MLKAETGQKLGLLHQTASQIVTTKDEFLKEVRSYSSEHMDDKKKTSLLADMGKVLVVLDRSNQPQYSL